MASMGENIFANDDQAVSNFLLPMNSGFEFSEIPSFLCDKSFGVVDFENNQIESQKSLTELTTVPHPSQKIANTSGPESCDPGKKAATKQDRTDQSLNNGNVPDERQGGIEIVALETPATGPAEKSDLEQYLQTHLDGRSILRKFSGRSF